MRSFSSTKSAGPSLAEVLAFTLLADKADVARVAVAASRRVRGPAVWTGWRVSAVEVNEGEDELARILVHAEPVQGASGGQIFEFLADEKGLRPSQRFESMLRASGVTERVDDTREVEGRYFATKNDGRSPSDFGPLSLALGFARQ